MGDHSPRNLRVSDGWGLPRPLTRFRAPEPGGGAAGARGARRERAPGAGSRVPRARGRGGAGRSLRGGGRGRDRRKERGRGGGGWLQRPRTPRTSHICTGSYRAARRRPARLSLLPPSSRSVAPALLARLRHLARGRAHRQTALGTPQPAPPGRAMFIALPGPARGISTARPATPAASGDYEPESAALPRPPLSQPGHGLPPDRVRAARSPCTRAPAKLAWPGERLCRSRAAVGHQLPWPLQRGRVGAMRERWAHKGSSQAGIPGPRTAREAWASGPAILRT